MFDTSYAVRVSSRPGFSECLFLKDAQISTDYLCFVWTVSLLSCVSCDLLDGLA